MVEIDLDAYIPDELPAGHHTVNFFPAKLVMDEIHELIERCGEDGSFEDHPPLALFILSVIESEILRRKHVFDDPVESFQPVLSLASWEDESIVDAIRALSEAAENTESESIAQFMAAIAEALDDDLASRY